MSTSREPFHHTNKEFPDWLTRAEQDNLSSAETTLNSPECAEAFFFQLQQLDHNVPIKLSTLARIQTLYPQGLLNGRPLDIETLTSAFLYVGMRVPTKIFRADITSLSLSNDTEQIMSVPHASDTSEFEEMRKHAPARARWYTQHKHQDGTIELAFEVRDVDPANPTDSFEILSWLGTLEQIRLSAKQLKSQGESIVSLESAMHQIYRKHITSEIDMLEKRRAYLDAFLAQETNNNSDLVTQYLSSIKQMDDRIQTLRSRLSQSKSLAAQLFDEWLYRSDELEIRQAYPRQFRLHKSAREDHTPTNMVAQLVKERLKETGLPEPTDVLFGNDYSIRIFLAIGLFEASEFEELRAAFLPELSAEQLIDIQQRFRYEQIEQVRTGLSSLKDDDIRDAAEKFFLVQQLSLYSGSNDQIVKLRRRLFAPSSFKKIGLIRLVETGKSPLADPIDVLNPSSIDADVLTQLPQPVRDVLRNIFRNQQVILSVPYTLGNLTAQTLEAFSQTFEQPFNIGFMGKVGNASTGADDISVGQLTLPNRVYNQFNEEPLAVINTFSQFLVESGLPIHQAVMMTTLALTFQEPGEMEELMESLPEGTALTLDVELYHFMSWLQTYLPTLSEEQREKHKVVLRYYISDKTILPRYFNQEAHGQDKISQSLGMRGSIPLFIALFDILDQLAEKN